MAKKYKKPENKKHKPRKDLKDYEGKETENMVIDASGEPQPDVPRKIKYSDIGDSENMVYDVKDSDRAYPIKDMQDGNPKMAKHACKTFDKNVEEDAKDYIETMSKIDGGYMSKIKKLTKEQKEKLVREYVRRKITKILKEADEPVEEPVADTPEPATAPEGPADAPAPEMSAPPAEEPAPTEEEPADAPAPPTEEEPAEDPQGTDSNQSGVEQSTGKSMAAYTRFVELMNMQPGVLGDINMVFRVFGDALNNTENPKIQLLKVNNMKQKIEQLQRQLGAVGDESEESEEPIV